MLEVIRQIMLTSNRTLEELKFVNKHDVIGDGPSSNRTLEELK